MTFIVPARQDLTQKSAKNHIQQQIDTHKTIYSCSCAHGKRGKWQINIIIIFTWKTVVKEKLCQMHGMVYVFINVYEMG